jgi:hypothetical protein
LSFCPNSKFEQLEIVNIADNKSKTGANTLAYLKRLINLSDWKIAGLSQ